MRGLKGERGIELQVERDVDLSLPLKSPHVVHLEILPVGDRADPFDQVGGIRSPRRSVNDQVGIGIDFVDLGFHQIYDGLGMLEGNVAVENQPQVREQPLTALADANAFRAQDARHPGHRLFDAPCRPRRRGIHQRVEGPLAETQADIHDNSRHGQRRHRVGVEKPRNVPLLGDGYEDQPQDNHARAVDVGGKVQRVCFERLAVVFSRHPKKHPRSEGVNGQRDEHDPKGGERRLDVHLMDKQPAGSFEDDPGAGREQQRGFNEGRKGLDLPVAKRVRQVGGLIRLANRKVSDDSGHQIEARMRRLGKNPQALRHQSHDDLDGDQKHRGQDGGERGRLFLPKPWGAMHDKIISPRSALALKRRSVSRRTRRCKLV